MMDKVILVDLDDNPVGTMEKLEAHQKGLLHRAFSVFIFNSEGHLLLQQRALTKYHSPGLWTNSCCSHPRPGEDIMRAADRRLREELGFSVKLTSVFDFVYKADFDNGLTEYEFDHVLIGQYDGVVQPHVDEVADFRFESIEEIERNIKLNPEMYTVWFRIAFPKLESSLSEINLGIE